MSGRYTHHQERIESGSDAATRIRYGSRRRSRDWMGELVTFAVVVGIVAAFTWFAVHQAWR